MPSLHSSLRVSVAAPAAKTPSEGVLGRGGQDALHPSEELPRGMCSMIGVAYRTDEVFRSIQE